MEASYCSRLLRLAFAMISTERRRRGIEIQDVKVEVTGTFSNPGEPASDIRCRVQIHADTTKAMLEAMLDDLIRATDAVTEIQNTVRAGCPVRLTMD